MKTGELTNAFKGYLQEIARTTAKEAAEIITDELQERGPYWTGQFSEAWVARPGDVVIPNNQGPELTKREQFQGWEDGSLPFNRRKTDVPIPEPQTDKRGARITIGNQTTCRDMAMDLMPGRTPKPGNTAPQDWFIGYVQGGGMRYSLRKAVDRAARDPKIRNYEG